MADNLIVFHTWVLPGVCISAVCESAAVSTNIKSLYTQATVSLRVTYTYRDIDSNSTDNPLMVYKGGWVSGD